MAHSLFMPLRAALLWSLGMSLICHLCCCVYFTKGNVLITGVALITTAAMQDVKDIGHVVVDVKKK